MAAFPSDTFLGGLDAVDRTALLDAARRHEFAAGATLIGEGASDERVALVVSGRVKLEAHAASGRRVLLGLRGPGDLLGELRAIDGLARGARVTSLDPVTAGIVPMSQFTGLVAGRPQLAMAVLRMLAGRLRESDRRRLEFGTNDAVGRVCACLLDLARLYGQDDGSGIAFASPLTQEELGTWAGLSRPATTRALRQLRDDGLVDQRGRRFRLADPTRLRSLADR